MKPIGKRARDEFNSLARFRLGKIPPRTRPARARAAGNRRRDALVERRGDQRQLAVSRMTRERELLGVHERQRHQIINAPARGPRAARELAPVVLRIERDERVGVVARIRARIHAADVAAARGDQRPAAVIVLRDENREAPLARRNQQFHIEPPAMFGSELEDDLLNRHAIFRARFHRADLHVARRRRDGAEKVPLTKLQNFRAPRGPLFGRAHEMTIGEFHRAGEERHAVHALEVRRQFAAGCEPFFPRFALRQQAAQFLEINFSFGRIVLALGERLGGREERGEEEQERDGER